MNNVELLAPAGNFSKLKTALYFGADAAYLGGKEFSLRSFADNFSREELVSTGLALYGFQPLGLPRYTQLNAGDCLYPAVCKKLSSGSPFGEMHALYVRKSQAEEGRK